MPPRQEASLNEVILHYIKKAGDSGATMAQLASAIAENHKQWKPSSASPAVSALVRLGCAKQASVYGTRTIYYVRDWTEADIKRLSAERLETLGKSTKESSAPQIGLMIAIGKNKTEAISLQDARKLYQQLHEIFGGGDSK